MSTTHERIDDKSRGENHRALCLRCGIVTTHTVVASRNFTERYDSCDFHRVDWDDYEIIQCQNCTSVSFRHAHRDTEDTIPEEDELFERVLLYPPRRERPRLISSLVSIPWPLRDTYQETSAALDEGKIRLPAIGLRTCIEHICFDRGVSGPNLKARIDGLCAAGHITRADADYLQELREDVGNTGAHEVFPPQRSQLDAAMVVLESLIHRLYILPHEAKGIRRERDSRP